MRSQRYSPEGLLALAPRAFGLMFDVPSPAEPSQRDGIAVVDVRGPLMHHAGYWFDSYEGIASRVAAALASGPRAVVLSIDSPGGLVSGCFETARQLRAMCEAADVPLVAYVDGQATSAAYALATAAGHVCAPPSAMIGSIGVIDTMVDATRQAEMFGLSFRLIASGARKTDGNPMTPTSEEAIAASQARVDELAEIFFSLVAEHRGVSVDEIRALEAGIVHGAEAQRRGLIDEVTTFDALLAALASGDLPAAGAAANEDTMDEDEKKAREALQAILDDEDSDEKSKARAKRALAAMDEDDEESAESGEEDEPEPKKKDEDEASASVSAGTAGALAAHGNSVEARLEALERERETEKRTELLASRPDLAPGLVKVLSRKPLAEVRAIVAEIPKPKKPKLGDHAAAAQAAGTRGESQAGNGDGAGDQQRPEDVAGMDRAMGLSATKIGVKREGTRLFLGASLPADPVK